MKKTLFTIALSIFCIISFASCGKVDTMMNVKVQDGSGNEVKCSVTVSEDVCELFGKDVSSFNMLVQNAFTQMKSECQHPRTFVPEGLFMHDLKVQREGTYTVSAYVRGCAKNGFGVEGDVSDVIEILFNYKPNEIKVIW